MCRLGLVCMYFSKLPCCWSVTKAPSLLRIHRIAQDCRNKWVFSFFLKSNNLFDDYLILTGIEFKIWGPETVKALWPALLSRYLGTMRSPREADRRFCRPEDELPGLHSSTRYSGANPTMQCWTRIEILYLITPKLLQDLLLWLNWKTVGWTGRQSA